MKISDIDAHQLGAMHQVKLKTGSVTTTVKVSSLSYANACLASGSASEESQNAMTALYNYYKAAKAYKG